MKISYAITVCDEFEEIKKLINQLRMLKREEDEIVVLHDISNPHKTGAMPAPKRAVIYYLDPLAEKGIIKYEQIEFNGNFAEYKNRLNAYCTGDFIFQIDADEMPHLFLLENLPYVLENSNVDLLYVSRINTVEGITQEHIEKWGWNIDQNGWINFPDPQARIYRNSPEIKWEGKVHETIKGYNTYSPLPKIEEWCLYHPKTIERQEKQNNYYETL